MLKVNIGQGNRFDAEILAPKLFDADSVAQRLKVIAEKLYGDGQFPDKYADMGRPAHSPKVMMVTLSLQQKLPAPEVIR